MLFFGIFYLVVHFCDIVSDIGCLLKTESKKTMSVENICWSDSSSDNAGIMFTNTVDEDCSICTNEMFPGIRHPHISTRYQKSGQDDVNDDDLHQEDHREVPGRPRWVFLSHLQDQAHLGD